MRYLTSGQICSELQITKQTLKSWKDSGKLKYKKLSTKKILYDISSLNNISEEQKQQRVAIYGRVSNTKQKNDLDRQLVLLKEYAVSNGYIINEEISDIASGMNEQRLGLLQLISLVESNQIDRVIVSYKDRLTRFGFGYFVEWFSRNGVTIDVINLTKEEDFQKELTEDLISVVHHFSMKLYSNRRKISKEFKKSLLLEHKNEE